MPVNFRLISGELRAERLVRRIATGHELYMSVADGFLGECNRLILGTTRIWYDSPIQYLQSCGEGPVEITVLRTDGLVDDHGRISFIEMIRRGRFDLAEMRLHASCNAVDLVCTREEGFTAVAWAAYKARD